MLYLIIWISPSQLFLFHRFPSFFTLLLDDTPLSDSGAWTLISTKARLRARVYRLRFRINIIKLEYQLCSSTQKDAPATPRASQSKSLLIIKRPREEKGSWVARKTSAPCIVDELEVKELPRSMQRPGVISIIDKELFQRGERPVKRWRDELIETP